MRHPQPPPPTWLIQTGSIVPPGGICRALAPTVARTAARAQRSSNAALHEGWIPPVAGRRTREDRGKTAHSLSRPRTAQSRDRLRAPIRFSKEVRADPGSALFLAGTGKGLMPLLQHAPFVIPDLIQDDERRGEKTKRPERAALARRIAARSVSEERSRGGG
jgi:hypothetical protein